MNLEDGQMRHWAELGDGDAVEVVVTEEGVILDAWRTVKGTTIHVGTSSQTFEDIFQTLRR